MPNLIDFFETEHVAFRVMSEFDQYRGEMYWVESLGKTKAIREGLVWKQWLPAHRDNWILSTKRITIEECYQDIECISSWVKDE